MISRGRLFFIAAQELDDTLGIDDLLGQFTHERLVCGTALYQRPPLHERPDNRAVDGHDDHVGIKLQIPGHGCTGVLTNDFFYRRLSRLDFMIELSHGLPPSVADLAVAAAILSNT